MLRQAVTGLRTIISEHPNGKVGDSEEIVGSRSMACVAFFRIFWHDSMVHNRFARLTCNGTSTKAIVGGVRKLTNTCCA
jgi:hypothetical protein